ncbi:DNA/RNA helicase [Stenotrophomonas maltophilia]|nr:DNA/RNA helicase [Stenotrophomonas maltophilia]
MSAREKITSRLYEDLVGPMDVAEILDARPSDVYLTGILWPQNTSLPPDQDERLALAGGSEEVEQISEELVQIQASNMRRPSSAGLSFACCTEQTSPSVVVEVRCARYEPKDDEEGRWIRINLQPIGVPVELSGGHFDVKLPLPGTEGVRLNVKSVSFPGGMLATVTLVNGSTPEPGRQAAERATLFQTGLSVRPSPGTHLISRPSRKSIVDMDDESNALLFRHAREFATGHTCSAEWDVSEDGDADEISEVRTAWIPRATTPATSAGGSCHFYRLGARGSLDAATLASSSTSELAAHLGELCDSYAAWLESQKALMVSIPDLLNDVARRHLVEVESVLGRMRSGIERIISDEKVADAFRLANLAMDTQRRWNDGPLRWRPFQLGFLLLAMESTIDPLHPDRDVMDLLWFPTGGGKTEAYLGLVSMTAFYRRMVGEDPDDGDGVACLMRYTLRLLTTQQFSRAASTICACEAIRRGLVPSSFSGRLGQVPFSLGLWVGGDATPNTRAAAFDNGSDPFKPTANQLTHCPCCQAGLHYSQRSERDEVSVWCRNADCLLSGSPIPVYTVDEDIYARRPTMLLGTVDKFAQIVRKAESGVLLGAGAKMRPQLVLQDELHLIAGPLGTLTGLYETAIDLILSSCGNRPKIVGSTATIRRAQEQVQALFDRKTCQFPPPGLSAQDSGFAVVDMDGAGRRYVGVTTAGRSAKFTLQAVAASLLNGAYSAITSEEGDPYWTLLAYFNSLRELGGALVLMQDDVSDTLALLASRRASSARKLSEIEELTSRRSQADIRDMLSKLSVSMDEPGSVDVVLATNMVSVGVDIPRLGLMLVNGQPKTMAEYIQATSRVGRGKVAGLVVVLLNNAKPRDRSHFETFTTWHSSLYRFVEATSATPYASRARDRALHAVLVAVVRHLVPGMLDSPSWNDDRVVMARQLVEAIVMRASRVDPDEVDVRAELNRKLDSWIRRAPDSYWAKAGVRRMALMQGAEEAAAKRAAGKSIGQSWPTPNSMRGVEPATPFRLVNRLKNRNVQE